MTPQSRVEGNEVYREGAPTRGYLVDMITQMWVRKTGRKIQIPPDHWLHGPAGGPDRIGADFFERYVSTSDSRYALSTAPGLMESFDRLAGPGFDPTAIHQAIRTFYEETGNYTLSVSSDWSSIFAPAGKLLQLLFSRRLQQLNIPLPDGGRRSGMTNEVIGITDSFDGQILYAGWIRRRADVGSVVYVGAYSITMIPGHSGPCVKVVFPLPNGNAVVLLRPEEDGNGGLILSSSGQNFGDPGFYFVVDEKNGSASVRYLPSFTERIHLEVSDSGLFTTSHRFTIWTRPFLRLTYHIERS